MRSKGPAIRELTRRDVLHLGCTATLSAVALTGCDALSTKPSKDRANDGAARKNGREAPMLAEQVRAGDLPPVAERMPSSPLVVDPVDRIGGYGHSWNSALLGPADTPWLDRTIGNDYLVGWDRGWREVMPNIAQSFEVAQGGKEYTFKLRKGMRWSDGELFTTDDLVFAFEDVLMHEELFPVGPPPVFMSVDSRPAEVERVDDHTVRFLFSRPKGTFLQELATPDGGRWLTAYPRHYLERFHQKYASDVEGLVKESGAASWGDFFLLDKGSVWSNAELPSLFAWRLTRGLGTGTRVVAERNPYYWKTDPEGSQLPYLDRVTFDVVKDAEVMLLKATAGELNMHTRHFNSLKNKPVLARGRDRGGYQFIDLVPSEMNEMIIMVNLTHKDARLREIFQKKDFRIGLSHAINRNELNTAVLQRQGEPWQAAPRRESTFFDEEFAKQYTEYDEGLANDHLDRAGLTERDGDGFRLRPDGERVSFNVEVANPTVKDTWVSAMELVKGYWAAVGIDISVTNEDRTLWTERVTANEHDAAVWTGPGGLDIDALLSGHHYLPYNVGSRYAIAWADWYLSGGKAGEEPPAVVRRQLQLYNDMLTTSDEAEQQSIFRQVLQISKEQFYVIGTLQVAQGYGIVGNGFHNVPRSMADAWLYPTPGPSRPEQYFVTST
ncbi:ABC transporter substrate-binding protein [Actinopolymorpha sp. B9G3]|uniref:ABC transporter substrate-binding protein n=1 Tax=Actinopolymorpha sp. B9G3 TaxID=3158970 RepID=UPI0032D90AE3